MPERYFKNFREANIFAKNIAKARQNPFLKTTETGYVVVFDELVNSAGVIVDVAESGGDSREIYIIKSGQYWVKDEDEKLIMMLDSGASVSDIAAKLGRSNGAINSRLKKLCRIDNESDEINTRINSSRNNINHKYSDSRIDRMTLSDYLQLVNKNFIGFDLNVLSKFYNKLLMLNADEDTIKLCKSAMNKFKPPDKWVAEADFGGTRDEIKEMERGNFSDIRSRGRI